MFTHRLALGLGMTVGELTVRMGASEFEDWRRYYALEPWGATRDNLHAGMVASTLVKLLGNPKRRAPEAKDYLLRPLSERRRAETIRGLGWLRAVAKQKG